jgi:3-dehydroquinate dehydratase/shikimate dehydrogenase
MVIAEHQALVERGAKLVELRLDYLGRQPDLSRLLKNRPTPVVVACRRQVDRGRWRGSEEQRQALLRAAIAAEVEFVDLEIDVAEKIPRYGSTRRIISHHDFDETPDEEDLGKLYERMCRLDPDVIKLVTMANRPSDIVRVLKLVQESKLPMVGFCMGEFGTASRILCGKYGAPFTYASFSAERELAPGQIAFDEMKNVYRYDKIDAKTRVFGVIGDPIAHSLSPLVHNAAFAQEGVNAVYVPIRIPKGELAETLREFEWLDVKGYSVTIPHKEAALAFAHRSDAATKEIGAANTLTRDAYGVWNASNTDYEAALATLSQSMRAEGQRDETLMGKKVLMLGSGGVARAIGLGLVRAGSALTITSRKHQRAVDLATQLGCQHTKWENRGAGFYDIIVNCTPVGMHPHVDETPYPMHWFRDNMLVFDTVYNPENTLFLKEARAHGCRTASGLEMFVRQAAFQYERFTGQNSPLDLMRETLRRGISPISKVE